MNQISTKKDQKKRILLFVSDSDSLTLFKDTLTDFGFTVETVEEGKTEIADVETGTTAMVIADADFPGLPGLDILQEITSRTLNVPVIIIGNLSEKAILQAFRNGVTDYFPKPIQRSILKERIAVLINKRKEALHQYLEEDVKKLLGNITRDNEELNNLLKISSSFNISSDSKAILNRLTELAAESMNCEAASIMLLNERENVLEFVVATGSKKQRLETMTIPVGEGVAGWVAKYGEPQVVNDTSKDARFTGKVDKQSGFVTKQILAIPLQLENRIIGVLEIINSKDNRNLGDNDLRVLNAIGERAATVIETTRKIETQQNFYIQSTNILVKAVEKKDVYSEGHAWRVAELCHKISLSMNLSDTERNDLHFGALLHDIGKLDMPSSLFTKRTISEREYEYIRQHPVKGAKLLDPINIWRGIVPYVMYHHEAWDGSGYPFGRAGDSIPLGARIINLAEAFSVMRAPNTYKKQMSLKETVLDIMRVSGKQFDPDVVKVFIGVLEKGMTRR